jgi:hypothetical protein
LVDRVDFGPQSPDKSMGRSGGEIVALANPSPGGINGEPAVNPEASFVIEGDQVTLTATAEPGFLYVVEASDDLINWTQVGEDILATGSTVVFTGDVGEGRRFYRFRRTP